MGLKSLKFLKSDSPLSLTRGIFGSSLMMLLLGSLNGQLFNMSYNTNRGLKLTCFFEHVPGHKVYEATSPKKSITENVDEILEEQDGTRQTRSKANNLIKSTAQSSSHSATQEVKRQRDRPKKTAI
ncbi:hypothetical protein BpHYR1_048539 [Brachionus plicatilis]|uniref:Uncharacterized protein n=1 Tax=Brachionus plicatilis TaxID=10195 RepID=A0A3M7QKW9_BRAPC|nr:hypothetical protein BpHYR1_048539 [Brachionus plicatilis]